jgi:hypothetical protein
MEEDDELQKGTAVTNPIELRAKKAGAPVHEGVEKSQDQTEISAAKGACSPAAVSMLDAVRVRKAPKPEIVEQIGHRLRGVYNEVLMQPIPGRFLDLLATLESVGPPGAPYQQGVRSVAGKKDAK